MPQGPRNLPLASNLPQLPPKTNMFEYCPSLASPSKRLTTGTGTKIMLALIHILPTQCTTHIGAPQCLFFCGTSAVGTGTAPTPPRLATAAVPGRAVNSRAEFRGETRGTSPICGQFDFRCSQGRPAFEIQRNQSLAISEDRWISMLILTGLERKRHTHTHTHTKTHTHTPVLHLCRSF